VIVTAVSRFTKSPDYPVHSTWSESRWGVQGGGTNFKNYHKRLYSWHQLLEK